MSHYSSALLTLVKDEFEGRQSHLSNLTGIPQSIISRHINGDFRPDHDTLEKLCDPLTPENKAMIAIAHLRDEIPPTARPYISIEPKNIKGSVLKENPPQNEFKDLDKTTKKAFLFLASKAVEHPDLREAICTHARFLGADV